MIQLIFFSLIGGLFSLIGGLILLTRVDLAKKIKRATGSASVIKIEARELPEDDPEKRRPDISRAKKLLGWQPKIKFSQGLKKTIAYFREKLANEPK